MVSISSCSRWRASAGKNEMTGALNQLRFKKESDMFFWFVPLLLTVLTMLHVGNFAGIAACLSAGSDVQQADSNPMNTSEYVCVQANAQGTRLPPNLTHLRKARAPRHRRSAALGTLADFSLDLIGKDPLAPRRHLRENV